MQGRELYLGDFIKKMFNIGLGLVAYGPTSFKPGMIIDMTELYNFDLHSKSQGY